MSLSSHPAESSLPAHAHEAAYLSFVLHGAYLERVGTHRLECGPLTVRYHPAGEQHSNIFGAAGGCCLNIELGPSWRDALARLPQRGGSPLLLDSAAWLGVRAVSESRRSDRSSDLALESIVADLLAECAGAARVRRAGEERAPIQRALEFIEAGLHGPLTLAAIAAAAGRHPTHLARTFRRTVGHTVGGYVRHRRLARAQRLLLEQRTVTVSRVAADTGFADHAHLARWFRKVTGTTPSRYRRADPRLDTPER